MLFLIVILFNMYLRFCELSFRATVHFSLNHSFSFLEVILRINIWSHLQPCRFAAQCKRAGCTFYHPTAAVPPRHALKWTKAQSRSARRL